jgi:2-haloacid dehalogenase
MHNKTHTIIFDLGGVLIDWNPEYVYRKRIPDEARRRFFFENICTHDWNVEQDAGRSIADATDLLVGQWPDWEAEIRAFYGQWEEMLGGPIEETVEILRTLKSQGKVRLLALTNWSAETFPVALARYDFLHWFEGIVVSGAEKTRKPFEDIYTLLLQRYAVEAEGSVFIDDNQKNVEAARALGMGGIQFESATKLCEELRKIDVYPLSGSL